MTDGNPLQHGFGVSSGNDQNRKHDVLDRQLDAALAKYAAVEPRTGLEERVLASLRLANLRIDQQHAARRSWWRWPAVAALTAAIALTVSLVWRSAESTHRITVQHPPALAQTNAAGTQVANDGRSGSIPSPLKPVRTLKQHTVSHAATAVAFAPKLDQFPSPQPLSEQETILARYVTRFPEHAALIAQARTEELRRDSAEEIGEAGSAGQNSKQRNK